MIFLSFIFFRRLYYNLFILGIHFLNLSKKLDINYFEEAKHPLLVPLVFLLFKLIFTSTPLGYESFTFSKHCLTKNVMALSTF